MSATAFVFDLVGRPKSRLLAAVFCSSADKAKGAIKDAAGKVTGDKELQTEGKLDKAKGSAHNAVGDVKDALRNASKDD
jgi:uncharacterized protein YjbJ (UPF0337 family)